MARPLLDAREEALLGTAFWLAGVLVLMRTDAQMLDVRIWATVLFVQSIPSPTSHPSWSPSPVPGPTFRPPWWGPWESCIAKRWPISAVERKAHPEGAAREREGVSEDSNLGFTRYRVFP